jgi:hypothetical protein
VMIWRCPVLSLAYQAAESGDIQPTAAGDLHLRFSTTDLLLLTAERLEQGMPTQQAYAARHLGWLLYHKRKPHPYAVVDDPALKQRLIDGLVAASRSGAPDSVDAACFALMALGEDHRRPELLLLLDPLPGGRTLSLMPLRQCPDDPLVTTHLLTWYRANPENHVLLVILGQNDPRVDELMEMVLRSPSYGSLRQFALTLPRAASPARLATVRWLCSESDPALIPLAMKILKAAPDAVVWILDVRCDPTAGLAHAAAEDYLAQHAGELSLEQRNRWLSAPPLPEKHSP